MKRDMDTIREILMFFEETEEIKYNKFSSESYNLFEQGAKYGSLAKIMSDGDKEKEKRLDYNFIQLINAGYINVLNPEQDYPIVNSLTWEGHDFLDNIKNKYIWDELNNQINEKGMIGASIDIIKDMANKIARNKLGL